MDAALQLEHADNSRISATVKLEQNLSMEYTAQVARQIALAMALVWSML